MDNRVNRFCSNEHATFDRMYLDFYDLKEPPFSITPDPSFLYLSSTHQNVLERILYGITSRLGFILLIGEVGTGKTTICRSILDTLEGKAETVYVINPSLSGEELISTVLDDLGIDYPPNASKKDLIECLNRFLLLTGEAKPVVIIIDDAQTMSLKTMEDLRLLSNLETDKTKLVQMLLVGQPELIDILNRPEMRQLRQRIAINCRLEFLKQREIEQYISRRLFIAGDKGRIRYTRRGVRLIYQSSGGIPRLINRICDYALVAGYVANDFNIEPTHIRKALKEIGYRKVNGGYFSIGCQGLIKNIMAQWLPLLILIVFCFMVVFGYALFEPIS